MCRYAQFTLSSRQLNYRGFPLIFLNILILFYCITTLITNTVSNRFPVPNKHFYISTAFWALNFYD